MQWASEVFTALSGIIIALVGAGGAWQLIRTRDRTEQVARSVGETNGRGSIQDQAHSMQDRLDQIAILLEANFRAANSRMEGQAADVRELRAKVDTGFSKLAKLEGRITAIEAGHPAALGGGGGDDDAA